MSVDESIRPPPAAIMRREASRYESLSPQERRARIDDARASNPRGHRLFHWVDPIGTNLRYAGSLWTIVEEANVTPGPHSPTVYQVALNPLRGCLVLGPLRELPPKDGR